MKNFIKLFLLSAMIILSNGPADANWIKSENYMKFTPNLPNGKAGTPNTQHTPNTPHSKSDSLPAGVTKEFLNSLTDEKGQKIIRNEDPEGDAMQERFFTGFAASDQFGYSVSSAGDVNGDGYSDLIIGAPFNDAGGANAGRAYIYYGGAIINSGVDLILTGLAAGDQLGFSVSTAGDANGDGYSDVIVSAPLNDAIGANAGRAYIYFGGSTMNNSADVILSGATANDQFGTSVSLAGDFNGDGYSDVIVGANLNDAGGSNAGRAYIYYGGSVMNSVVDITLTGLAASDQFGLSVSTAGDINGDGYGDVIAGALLNDGGGSNAGRAYIYYGGSSPDNTADVLLTGAAVGDQFGISVSTAGDVNGDGYSDVIAGANLNDVAGTDAGSAYIYFGGSIPDNTADVILSGVAGDRFGFSVSTAGDVNGDGYSDVIAGALQNDAGGADAGRSFIYFGGINMDITADAILTGAAAGDQFGFSVSAAGDMNGDGYSDVITGANGNDAGGSSAGRVYLYLNSMTGTDIADEFFTGEAANDALGNSVSTAGDVNGDGFNDIIVGAPYNNAGGSAAGRSYIYFGGTILNNTADVVLTGKVASEFFGISVSSAGDVNGDGYSDVIVGAYGNNTLGSFTGRVYVYFGGINVDTVADVIMTGAASGDQFGISVSSAGDVNGDGYSDVIVGADFNDSAGATSGRAYIYLGGSTMNNIVDVIMTGAAAGDQFGGEVSSAGDLNGDGYDDIIVGAFLNDAGGTSAGRAYVYFGGNFMNNIADLTFTGAAAGDQFGTSVSSAGDVNGDGYNDVISGASDNDAGGSGAGRSYIFYGGIIPDNIPDVTLTGATAGDNFGFTVSEAGDVNFDGYDDVIIGTPYDNTGGTEAGRVFVYFGGILPDSAADVILSGSNTFDFFGISVSSAGDMNGDGYGDIIVGAYQNDAGGTTAGRAYLYLSSAPSVKPILNTVKDVPNDQGGQVYLKWVRSGYDVQSIGTITDYVVQRSYPPSGGNFSWENIAYIPATNEQFYAYTASTPFDSISNSSGTLYFRITARTSISTQYWRSNILFGRSIDNIAPLMVSPFTASSSGPDVRTNWKRSTSPDLLNYVLYRSTAPTIDPDTEPVFATTTDSTYLDTAPLSGVYYYFIVAQDIHNNKSPVAITESPNMTLNLTMFIEGFYNAGSNSQISDTITVELRYSISPFAAADQTSAVLSANGTVQLKFGNAINGNYYIAVKHRNSIETWSAGVIALSRTTPASFDLASSLSQAFGNNLKSVDTSPVRFAIFSGDVNQDGTIDASDLSDTDNDAFNSVSGYVSTDVTGDDFVDAADVSIVDNNAFNAVSAVTP
ncbi:MAG: FG-GAP repeat protein [Ignavibacteria bacterium]|nr:FG-GAP repeat protein [Ignavibacteria bacterium]